MTRRLKNYFRRYRAALLTATASIVGTFGFTRTSHALVEEVTRSLLGPVGAFMTESLFNEITDGFLGAAGGLAGFFGFYIVNFLNYVIVKLFTFAGFLIDLGITLNQEIITNGLVRVGWLITRDIANMGFTVGIIAIAFATILRMEQYSVKKLLGKLIIVALLINFSLAIPGVILDGTHVFSKFFMSKITGDERAMQKFSDSIAAAFNIQDLVQTQTAAALNVDSISDVFVLISSVLFLALFGTLGVIALGATAYMVFYRYMMLTFLFIIAPLAWISLFLPGFSKHWKEWWDMFFKWAFFLPLMTFFFYLAIYAAQSAGDVNIVDTINSQAAGSIASISGIGRLAAVLGQMVVILGLLVGGLMVSQRMGIAGAAAAVGMATGVKNFALGAIKGAAVGAVAGPAKYLGARPVKAGAMGLANLLNKPALRWIPGMKGAAAGLSGFGKRLEETEAYRKQYLSNLSNEQLDQTTKPGIINKLAAKIPYIGKALTTSLIDSPVDTAATLSEYIKRKRLNKLFESVKDDPKKKAALVELFAAAAQKINPGTDAKDIEEVKALLGFKPTLTSKITGGKLTAYEGARKFAPADKAHELDIDEVNSMSVISTFTDNHWEDLIKNPSTPTEVLIGAQNTLEKLAGPELVKLQQEFALVQMQIDRAKQEGVSENDVFALDDRGRKIKGADGKFVVAQKGLKTMKREKNVELNKRLDELFLNASTITAEDRENYADVIRDKRMNEPNFIENLKKQFKEQYNRELRDDELDDNLIFTARGQVYKQLEDMKKRVGGLLYRPKTKGGGGPGGGPTGGPIGGPSGPGDAPVSGGPTGTPPGGPTAGGIPPRGAPATGGYERTPAEEVEIASAVEELKKERAREAAKTPPRTAGEVRERAEAVGGDVAPAGRPAPLPKEKETRGAEEAERRAKAEEARAEAAKKTAEAAKETTVAEEVRLKAAEKAAEAAAKGAKAAEAELKAREAALGVTKETGKETEKILREIEGGAKAAEKTTEELKKQVEAVTGSIKNVNELVTGDLKRWFGKTIVTPDGKERRIVYVVRNNVNSENGEVYFGRQGDEKEYKMFIKDLQEMVKGGKEIKVVEKKT